MSNIIIHSGVIGPKSQLRRAATQNEALDVMQAFGYALNNYGPSVMTFTSHNGTRTFCVSRHHEGGWKIETVKNH